MRESPALKLIELLEGARRGGRLPRSARARCFPPSQGVPAYPLCDSSALDPERIRGFDAVLIVTDHDALDYAALVRHAKLVVDTRNACHARGLAGGNIVKA